MTPTAPSTSADANAQAKTNQGAAAGNYATVSGNNSQLNGAIADTGYYKNETAAGANATTRAFDNSRQNLKQSMEAAGVQGNSGVAAGGEAGIQAQEAKALGDVKTNAYADTEKQQLAANAQDLAASGQQTQAAQHYADINNQDEMAAWQQGQQNQAAAGQAAGKLAGAIFGL